MVEFLDMPMLMVLLCSSSWFIYTLVEVSITGVTQKGEKCFEVLGLSS